MSIVMSVCGNLHDQYDKKLWAFNVFFQIFHANEHLLPIFLQSITNLLQWQTWYILYLPTKFFASASIQLLAALRVVRELLKEEKLSYLTELLPASRSCAVTAPIMVPTGVSSYTSIVYMGLLNTGGSSMSNTLIFTVAVSLNGPTEWNRWSRWRLEASTLKVYAFFVSKSNGCRKNKSKTLDWTKN